MTVYLKNKIWYESGDKLWKKGKKLEILGGYGFHQDIQLHVCLRDGLFAA